MEIIKIRNFKLIHFISIYEVILVTVYYFKIQKNTKKVKESLMILSPEIKHYRWQKYTAYLL